MGKPTGFLDYERKMQRQKRLWRELNISTSFTPPCPERNRRNREPDVWHAACRSASPERCWRNGCGCPLQNLVPEWNDLIYIGNWEEAYYRLFKTNNFPEFTSEYARHSVRMHVPADCMKIRYLRRQ